MKAVILAGGDGKRLRPLTCDIPKSMARLCAKPILEYILDLLKKHGCTSAAVTLHYLPSSISRQYDSGQYKGMELEFIEEDEPLGTAGGVKNAASGFEEDFVVISGDILCDFNLTNAFDFHKQNHNDITVITKRVEDPREYGLVTTDKYGKITGFLEKPSWRQVYTDTVNTGIYIISPSALSMIPSGQSYDFANDLFPDMLNNGCRLMAYEANGYWSDIGDIDSYIKCQRDILTGRVSCDIGVSDDGIFGEKRPEGEYTVIPPVYIGENVTICDNAVIGPNTVIDNGSYIGRGAKIKRSIILPYSNISDKSNISGAVICSGAVVNKSAQIFEGAIVGSHAVIGKNANVLPNVRIWPHKRVESDQRVSHNLQYGTTRKTVFDDTGICGESCRDITPEYCTGLGAVLGSMGKGVRIAVGGDFGRASRCFRMAIMSGIMSTGGHTLDFGDLLLSQFNYSVGFSSCDMGVYVLSDGQTKIILSENGGLPICRKTERDIEDRLNRGDIIRCGWEDIKYPIDMRGMSPIYLRELLNCSKEGLFGVAANIKASDSNAERILRETLQSLGCALSVDGAMNIHISATGTGAAIYSDETGYIWQDKVMLMSLIPHMESGHDIALPYDAPEAANELADRYGVKVLRYFSSSGDKRDEEARKLAKVQHFVRDGFFQIVSILDYMNIKGISLEEYYNLLPKFNVARREVLINSNVMALLRSLNGINTGDGVLVRNRARSGRVLVRPDRNAIKLQLIAEGNDMEIADELCCDVSDEIKRLNGRY